LRERPNILSIAGFDPCGGAGVLSDIKTFEFHKCLGMAVITANTIQTEDTFISVGWLANDQILLQLETLLEKYKFEAVKIGVIESFDLLNQIVHKIRKHQPNILIVWDTVLSATSGFDFISEINKNLLTDLLLYIDLITPNAIEIIKLTEFTNVNEGAKFLSNYTNVLLKGGHRADQIGIDTLFTSERIQDLFPIAKDVNPKHGSGCMLSSAIVSNLALGSTIEDSCRKAKLFIEKQLSSNSSLLAYYA